MSGLLLSTEQQISRLGLSQQEINQINDLLQDITSQYSSTEDDDFLKNACLHAHELPTRVREFLNDFKFSESNLGICIISGYPIDDNKIGDTPSHWQWRSDTLRTLDEQILLVLYGSLLGDVFGWSTQQDGYIVHDVFPIKSHENEQLGSGSSQVLWWHTEDAFHPYRADYLGLMCLRNPDQVPTTVGSFDVKKLTEEEIQVLFESRFIIRPDESHLEKNESEYRKKVRKENDAEMLYLSYEKINKMYSDEAEKVSIFWGNREHPYFRIDPYFMDELNDELAQNALNHLVRIIDDNILNVVLQPGDCLLIDNYRAVHGRKGFKARYNGKDRWLKRINVTRDLRKSRESRQTSTSRVIV